MDDLHELHLLELVLTKDAVGVLAGVAGLAAKTGGVGHVSQGELVDVDNAVADQIGDGHLRRGNQKPIPFAVDGEQVGLELG